MQCVLRALAEDKSAVGEAVFTPEDSGRLSVPIRTERRATAVEKVGCTAHLTVVEGAEALALAVVEPSWTDFHVSYRVGTRHPLAQGAAGKAVANYKLSNQEAALQERFLAEYQEIAPGTSEVLDPLAIITSLRNRTGASDSGPSILLQSMQHLGDALQDNEAASIQAVSYRSGITNVRLTAPSVAVLDSIQRLIDESGTFQADIQSTDQNDDEVNSRIEIKAATR